MGLRTEESDPRYADLDRLPVGRIAELMNDADRTVPDAVRAAFPALVPALEAVSERVVAGGRLLYVGAGTPGRLGVLDASEVPPTFGMDADRVVGIIAGGERAIRDAVEGAEDDADAGAAAIDAAGAGPADAVVGVAASGRTPFVLGAIRRARELGALTVGVACNPDSATSAAAEHAVEIVVGPEVVSGSTRLKAGTAQKLVLNMFSTIAMVRLGRTYGGLMVDVRVTNAKLRGRAERIVGEVAGVDDATAARALEAAGDRVPTAIVALRLGVDPARARELLGDAGGRLRTVLDGDPG